MEWIQGIEWSGFPLQLGEYAGITFMMLAMTYVFIWFTIPILSKSFDEIRIPPFIYFKKDRAAEQVTQQASSDTIIVQGIYETGENLEYQAREQMRRVMTRVMNKYMSDNTHNPVYQDYLLRARLTISNAIADNHIVYSLAQDRVQEYLENKQIQVIDSVSVDISQDHNAVEMLKGLTKEFVGQVLPIQRKMCMEKISSYRRALQLLQLDGNRALCQAKIDKNENYLAAMKNLENTPEYKSVVFKRFDDAQSALDGAELMEQNVNKTRKALDKLEAEGKLKNPNGGSSILDVEKNNVVKKRGGRAKQ